MLLLVVVQVVLVLRCVLLSAFITHVNPSCTRTFNNSVQLQGRTRMMCVLSKFGAGAGAGRWQLIVMGDPMHGSMDCKGARAELIRRTRPDLLRPVHVDFGVISAHGIKAADRGGTSDP